MIRLNEFDLRLFFFLVKPKFAVLIKSFVFFAYVIWEKKTNDEYHGQLKNKKMYSSL